MGGQQFGTDMILVDMTGLNQIVSFDPQRGLAEVQAGARNGASVQAAPIGLPLRDEVVILAVPYTAEAEIIQQYHA